MRAGVVQAGVSGLVLVVATMALVSQAAADPARLGWMEGRWTGEKDGVAMEEVWTGAQGGALIGMHKDVAKGRMVSFEFLRIQATPEGTVYFASPKSAPVTAFRMTSLEGRRVVFANEAHDFPQRVLYWLDDTGALHARIEGKQGGRELSEEWVWRKAP